MNNNLRRLVEIAGKRERIIVGLMSGTSLDGLDIAYCSITDSGRKTRFQLLDFETIPYPEQVRESIRSVFSLQTVDLRQLCLLNPWIARLHAAYILGFLRQRKIPASHVDLVASHGQTVYHAPRSLHKEENFPDATLQLGDGDHIAAMTGIITISDFRQKHIAAGGEGAPLAVYGDHLLFSDARERRIMLNLGGIANFTYLPPTGDGLYRRPDQIKGPERPQIMVTDTGPGNTLLDAYARQLFGLPFDKDAGLARQGTVNEQLLRELLSDDFFKAPVPKSTGPELFNADYVRQAQIRTRTEDMRSHDLMATLTRFSADSIVHTLQQSGTDGNGCSIYASGGGAHNPLLMEMVAKGLPHARIGRIDDLGVSPDAKEAVLFAVLANETVAGNPEEFAGNEIISCSMGKISFPF